LPYDTRDRRSASISRIASIGGTTFSRGGMDWGIDYLANAVVIEKNQNTSRRAKNSVPALPNRRTWMIDLKTLSGIQFHSERFERSVRHQNVEGLLEILRSHAHTL
jgi:hypothetical protein